MGMAMSGAKRELDDAGQPSAPTSSRPPPIVVRGLDHWFGEGEAAKQALFDIDSTSMLAS
jgi:hypothetical protein